MGVSFRTEGVPVQYRGPGKLFQRDALHCNQGCAGSSKQQEVVEVVVVVVAVVVVAVVEVEVEVEVDSRQ